MMSTRELCAGQVIKKASCEFFLILFISLLDSDGVVHGSISNTLPQSDHEDQQTKRHKYFGPILSFIFTIGKTKRHML